MKTLIKFKRTEKMHEEINALYLSTLDDPRYRFLHAADWHQQLKEMREFGWTEDAFLIVLGEEVIGFITWSVNRNHNKVTGVFAAFKPKYLNKGYGPVALAGWLDYAMNDRKFRKVEFSCHRGNVSAEKIYNQIEYIGGRLAGFKEESAKLRDGLYYDVILFEILWENFSPTDDFKKLLERFGG